MPQIHVYLINTILYSPEDALIMRNIYWGLMKFNQVPP